MNRKLWGAAAALAAGLLVAAGTAQAGPHVSWSVTVGSGGYYPGYSGYSYYPGPVYSPAPQVVAAPYYVPAPVYYQPVPVYVQPPVIYGPRFGHGGYDRPAPVYGDRGGWGHGRDHGRHWHRRD
jgi:hypothetical protein